MTRVLIVDDEICYVHAVRDLLSGRDFEVYVTETIEGAREMLDIEDFHIVVTGMKLDGSPGGGIELVTHIKTRRPATKVIVVSADGDPARTAMAYYKGADMFFQKPVERGALLSAICSMGRHGAESAA